MNCPTKNQTKAIVYSCCWWGLRWLVCRGAEQCRPEAWAVRGKASMPEAPLEWGGIATNGRWYMTGDKTDELNYEMHTFLN